MGECFVWLNSNWFSLVQTVGIAGSLWLTAAASNREAKAQEISNVLTIADHHRNLWNGLNQRKDLERVFRKDADILMEPPTDAEKEFLNLVIVHYLTGWRIAKAGGVPGKRELVLDIRGFFSSPLPRAVWESTKQFRDRKFVSFVNKALKG